MSTMLGAPLVRGTIAPDGTASVTGPDGVSCIVPTTEHGRPLPLDDVRRRIITTVAHVARDGGHERVHAQLSDPATGTSDLLVTAAGDVEPLPRQVSVEPLPTPVRGIPIQPIAAATSTPDPQTFIVAPDEHDEPAQLGWRGAVNRLGVGLAPAPAEASLRRAVRTLSQRWEGVRTIAVANAKGSANKTPTTICLAAALARYGGGGVAAVDNNPTRGTLPWRTQQGPHQATVTDLLPHVDRLMNAATAAQLAAFLHHQERDGYDVLRSKPERLGPPFTAPEFDQVVRLLAKFYRVLVFDSGNDETAPVWQHMIRVSSQLVVPTLARRECAEAGRLLLEELAANGFEQLAANAVVIVSQADERRGIAAAEDIAAAFADRVRATAVIPYDPHMVEGHLRWDGLANATRDAWTRAAALVVDHF